jgi:hypothetical protein
VFLIKKILKLAESRNMVRVLESALGRNVCKLTGKLFAFQAEVKGSSPFTHKRRKSIKNIRWKTRRF